MHNWRPCMMHTAICQFIRVTWHTECLHFVWNSRSTTQPKCQLYWCHVNHKQARTYTQASLIVCVKFQLGGVYCSIILTLLEQMKTDKHRHKNNNKMHAIPSHKLVQNFGKFRFVYLGMWNLWAFFHMMLAKAETSQNPTELSITYFAVLLLLFGEQITHSMNLLILFGMHLKCSWMAVVYAYYGYGWWKFCLRMHASEKHHHAFNVDFIQHFNWTDILCIDYQSWFTKIPLWIWPKCECGPKLKCSIKQKIPLKMSFQFASNLNYNALVFYWPSYQKKKNVTETECSLLRNHENFSYKICEFTN